MIPRTALAQLERQRNDEARKTVLQIDVRMGTACKKTFFIHVNCILCDVVHAYDGCSVDQLQEMPAFSCKKRAFRMVKPVG